MRVLLFTGKGGVGKTTAAAGTATLAAVRGLRTLVLSTDAAHSLGDAFDATVGDRPTEVDEGLFVQQVDAQRRLEQSWGEIQTYLLSVMDAAGIDPIGAEELTVLPGAEEVLALLELREQARSGRYDVVIVDCAPTAETLRLLAMPEVLDWYMQRIFPMERRVVGALRPVLNHLAKMPMPTDNVFGAIERLHKELAEVRTLLTSDDASVRLVLTPEAVVVAEARRTLTTLSLFGYRVDGVVANRVFPAADADPWRKQWVAAQQVVLTDVEASFAPIPVYRSPYRSCEPIGLAELAAFAAEAYGRTDPLARPQHEDLLRIERTGDGYELRIALPLADRSDLALSRKEDELVVTVGSYRRVLALPAALRRAEVMGAALADERLVVRFGHAIDEPALDSAVEGEAARAGRT